MLETLGCNALQECKLASSKGEEATSSVLLECERAMPLSSWEVNRGFDVLYAIAALCEELIERVLDEVNLLSLLEACRDILATPAIWMTRGTRSGYPVLLGFPMGK